MRLSTPRIKQVGKTPTEITLELEVKKPIEEVWAAFAKVEDIYLSASTVSRSTLVSEVKRGMGAQRHMEMSIMPGATLDERVIGWEEGVFMELEAVEIKGMPGLATMGGTFDFTRTGSDSTVLRSTLNYSMSNGFFGIMNRMMMSGVFTYLWKSILSGYKLNIETGQAVTGKTKLPTLAVRKISKTIQ